MSLSEIVESAPESWNHLVHQLPRDQRYFYHSKELVIVLKEDMWGQKREVHKVQSFHHDP